MSKTDGDGLMSRDIAHATGGKARRTAGELVPIVLHMTVPPSANRMWLLTRTRRRTRQLTPEYAAWRDSAGWEVRRQMVGIEEITCRFDIDIEVPAGRGDLDNLIKPALDLLQLVHVISNDGNAAAVSIRQRVGRDGCMVAITPRPDLPGVRAAAKLTYRRAAIRPKVRRKGITSAMLVGLGVRP